MNRITGLITAGMFAAATMGVALAASPPTSSATPSSATPTSAPASPAASTAPAATTDQGSAAHKGTVKRTSMSKKQVEAIQQALNSNGEQVTVDGVLGPKTRSALKSFQQKHGIKATGRADEATLGQLKVAKM